MEPYTGPSVWQPQSGSEPSSPQRLGEQDLYAAMRQSYNDCQDAPLFEVSLDKGSPPRSLGFNFKKPSEVSRAKGFLIVAIIPGGVLGQYNAAQASAGAWDKVVLPGMRIRAVNGIENSFTEMLKELKDRQAVVLRIQSTKKTARVQMPAVTSDYQNLLRDRMAGLLIQNKERLRQAMASDSEYQAVSVSMGSDIVREVLEFMAIQQSGRNPAQSIRNQSDHMRPASVPSGPRYSNNNRVPTAPMDLGLPSDDDALSEESV